VGTWKLNLTKSKSGTGTSPLQSFMTKIEAQENGIKFVEDGVDSNGKSLHVEFDAKYDGKDYPFRGDPDVDTVALTRVDANTFDLLMKKAGKGIVSSREVVSEDGKTWTETEKVKDARGGDIVNVWVYDKQ